MNVAVKTAGNKRKRSKQKKSAGSSTSSIEDLQTPKRVNIMAEKASGDDLNGSTENGNEDIREMLKVIITENKKQNEMLENLVKKHNDLYIRVISMEEKVGGMDLKIAEQGKSLDLLHHEVILIKQNYQSVTSQVKQTEKKMEAVTQQVAELQVSLQSMNDCMIQAERKSREKNLRIIGRPEQESEDCLKFVKELLSTKFNMNNVEIEVAHRTGRRSFTKPRHIIFKVLRLNDKALILKTKREALQGTGLMIVEDLPKADLEKKKQLQPEIMKAKAANKKWSFRNGTLFIDGKKHEKVVNTAEELHVSK
jgi:hypothetical protein